MGISIVIPIYNVEHYLPRCLDSVCAQADCVNEIILINDGSTDKSLEICKSYARKDKRIKIINQANKGLSATVRVGVKSATSKFVGFVDSDDYVEPEMFKVMYDKIVETDADIVFCSHDKVDENGIRSAVQDYGINKENAIFEKENGRFPCPLFPTLKDGRFIPSYRVNKLMKREALINNVSFEDKGIRVGEDVALIVPIMFAATKIVYINKCLYHYFQRSDSIVHTYNRNNLKDWHGIIDVLHKAAELYDYKIENQSDVDLAWLLSLCLYKIKISSLTKEEKKCEYEFIGEDKKVKRLLKEVKLKTNFKHKIVFSLLKHGRYGLLAKIY